jgi:hypothetical protein
MSFDQAEWSVQQRRQQSADRNFARKMAELAKKAARSGIKVTGRTANKSLARRATRGQNSWTKKGLSQALSYQQHGGGLAAIPYSRKQEGAILLDSNLLMSDPYQQVQEMRLEARRHPQTREDLCFVHWSISLNPRLHDLTNAEFLSVASSHLTRAGFDGCSFAVVLHPRNEAHGQHIHVIASRSKNGKLVSLSNSFWRFRQALRDVEIEHGLKAAIVPTDTPSAPTTAAVSAERRAIRLKTQSRVWVAPETILEQVKRSDSWDTFVERCVIQNIDVKLATRATDNVVTGILFKQHGAEEWLSGSSISRQCSLSNIKNQIEFNRQTIEKAERDSLLNQLQRKALQAKDRQTNQCSYEHPRGG